MLIGSIEPPAERKTCNRWMVAYTLLRNPSIQGLTASRLQESKAHEVTDTHKQNPNGYFSESGKEKEEVAGL